MPKKKSPPKSGDQKRRGGWGKVDPSPWLAVGKSYQAAYKAASRHAKKVEKALAEGKKPPPLPTAVRDNAKLKTVKSRRTKDCPWYFQDFTHNGKKYSLKKERKLYREWRDFPTDEEDQLIASWELFFELAKLSPAFFIHELKLPIRTKKAGKIPFDKWHLGQKLMYHTFLSQWMDGKPVRIIVLKARQIGLSTWSAALMFWRAILFSDIAAVVMTDKRSHSSNVRNMVGIFMAWMQDNIPAQFIPLVSSETKSLIEWGLPRRAWQKNGKQAGVVLDSSYRCMTAASSITERSWTVHALHASEVCFWKNAQQNWLGLSQSIADEPGTIVILETSADESSEFYKTMWDSAEAGESDYESVFIGWQTQEEYKRDLSPADKANIEAYKASYDKEEIKLVKLLKLSPEQIEWRRKIIKNKCNNSPTMFKQEYPSTASEAFVTKGSNVYLMEAILHYKEKMRLDRTEPQWRGSFKIDPETGIPVPIPKEDGPLTVWKEPEIGKTYAIGVDPAEGHGGSADDSCIQVLDAETYEQCAVFCSNIFPPDHVALQAFCLSTYYGNALIVPEANSCGGTLIFHLRNLEVSNMFIRVSMDKIGIPQTKKYGFYTTRSTKEQILELTKKIFDAKEAIFYDRKTLNQIATFTKRKDGKYGNKKKTGHDDCHDAWGLAIRGIHSDQLTWTTGVQAMGLQSAAGLLKSSRTLVEAGKIKDIHPQFQNYFDDRDVRY